MKDACLEPFLDQADDASVADAMFHKLDEPFLAHRVEERADVGGQYPVHLCAGDRDHERVDRIVRAASGSQPIRQPEEIFLVDRAQPPAVALWTILSSRAATAIGRCRPS